MRWAAFWLLLLLVGVGQAEDAEEGVEEEVIECEEEVEEEEEKEENATEEEVEGNEKTVVGKPGWPRGVRMIVFVPAVQSKVFRLAWWEGE